MGITKYDDHQNVIKKTEVSYAAPEMRSVVHFGELAGFSTTPRRRFTLLSVVSQR